HHWVLKQLKKGVDVILEIDWQGARQIRQLFPSTVSIFILPPSSQVLQERLHHRKQDSEAVITARMKEAVSEMAHCHEFDYLVVNDVFEDALADMAHIIQAERLRSDRQRIVHADLLADLLEKQ
ncbi:MAG: guanylate kinase, partial [Coxiellaceae bacterium]|nr:guanylate kinase [Coxiellaceae bacterium]